MFLTVFDLNEKFFMNYHPIIFLYLKIGKYGVNISYKKSWMKGIKRVFISTKIKVMGENICLILEMIINHIYIRR